MIPVPKPLELASLEWLLAHHGAKELDRIGVVNDLGIAPDSDVLDVACGPCLWTNLLADKIGPSGRLYSLDLSMELLAYGKGRLRERPPRAPTTVVRANFQELPFPSASFDCIFFSNGLAYAANPLKALYEQKRVARPGGRVVARHWNNSVTIFHPVPVDLLFEVQLGVARSLESQVGTPLRNFFGQRLHGLFLAADFQRISTKTSAVQFLAPLSSDARNYLTEKAEWMGRRARPLMSSGNHSRWLSYFQEGSPNFILDRDDFYFCTIEIQTTGRT
ncbi:MAG: methyltransferase domain-containing protein [Acidobacteriota bacterium]